MLTSFTKDLMTLKVAGQRLEIESVRGRFAVGELFELFAHLVASKQVNTTAQKLVGRVFQLKFNSPIGDELTVHGIVAGCEHHEDGNAEGFVLELRPWAYVRTLRRNSRVFQHFNVKQIVNDVLGASGPEIGALEWVLQNDHPERAYVAQYDESDWAFIERILAIEGIHYYFRFDDEDTVLVFSDDSAGAKAITAPTRVPLKDASHLNQEAAIVQSHHRASIATDQVRLREYDPHGAAGVLDESVTLGNSWREYYAAAAGFSDSGTGQRRVKTLGEAFGVQRRVLRAHTNVLRLIPGHKFELSGHSIGSHNIPYFITSLEVFARRVTPRAAPEKRKQQKGIGLSFTAIPLEIPFRLPVPQPRVAPGPQTAVVVGPTGQEIHTDDRGQIRAQFYWDREGKRNHTASTPMRVSQFPLAGSMMLPRIHWDQLIGFNAGNVDVPMVLGHLYDSVCPVPYALPEHKTRTAWQTATTPSNGTANEIRYEDKAGQEEIFLNASYDMAYEIGHDSSLTVGVDQTTEIGVNQTLSVGANQSLNIAGKHEVTVGATESLTVSGARSVTVGGNESTTIGATRAVTVTGGDTLDAKGGRSLTAGSLMLTAATMGIERMVLGKSSVTVGGAYIGAAAMGLDNVTAGASNELVGGAKIQAAGGGISTSVKGKVTQVVGGALVNTAGGSLSESSGKALTMTVGGAAVLAGADILIEAKSKLVIKVGATTLTMTPSKIHIKSPSLASPGATIAKSGSTVSHNP